MKLLKVRILNFRSCKDVQLDINGLHAIVGSNNAGKSTILKALDFFFNPSTKSLNEEIFWNKDTSLEIRVEGVFANLTDYEKTELCTCLKPDGTFHMARTAKMGTKSSDIESDYNEDKIVIGQQYLKPVPNVDWLQESKINGKNIKEWWKEKSNMTVNGHIFLDTYTKQPTVDEWKDQAKIFVSNHQDELTIEDMWADNPKGYANVLKSVLPFFILVPAVRDASEESKGTKSSPFGKLILAILNTVTEEKKRNIEEILSKVSKQMNRIGGSDRLSLISDTERKLNEHLSELFTGCDLEIEFETPTLEILLSTPRINVDDGFRSAVENKGHGLQRAIIFSILRQYAEYMASVAPDKTRKLILAIEEPELYMHPQAQRTIRNVFRKITENGDQVLFSTHSALLVDVNYFDEIIRVESECILGEGKKGIISKAWQLPMEKMIFDLEKRIPKKKGAISAESMRERYSHAYNPQRNEGFFAKKIILVEGQTEEYSLPIYADAIPGCSLDALGISIIECGGKDSIDRLYRIFNELHIPCYVIFDYDFGNTEQKIVQQSIDLLALLGLHDIDNKDVFVSEVVSFFPQKWETTLRSEIDSIDELTQEARQELGLNKDSKALLARYIARKLIKNNPASIPPSIKKILEKAVNVSWVKSCLEQ
jgi:predicted ATP-dependent endonuclease of OLD family